MHLMHTAILIYDWIARVFKVKRKSLILQLLKTRNRYHWIGRVSKIQVRISWLIHLLSYKHAFEFWRETYFWIRFFCILNLLKSLKATKLRANSQCEPRQNSTIHSWINMLLTRINNQSNALLFSLLYVFFLFIYVYKQIWSRFNSKFACNR